VSDGDLVHDVGHAGRDLCCGFISVFFGERGVPGEVEEGDRGQLPRLTRRDATLVHEALGQRDEVVHEDSLAVSGLEPRSDAADEIRVLAALFVDEGVLLLVRQRRRADGLPDSPVEELDAGRDKPLDAAAVETSEA
jgi:hypothetical protein